MSIVYCKKTRRQFLVGAGNTLLALPLLPSLFSERALAQTAPDKRLLVVYMHHNQCEGLWPQRAVATTPVGTSGTMEKLVRSFGSAQEISPILEHPLYENLRQRGLLTIARGFDAEGNGAYGHGLHSLGHSPNRSPTLDAIFDTSAALYPGTTSGSVTKAVRINYQGDLSIFMNQIGSTSQQFQAYGADNRDYQNPFRITDFYNDIFSSLTNGTSNTPDNTYGLKSNILNRVFASYQSFKGSRRISSDDKARLDQHMGYLSDLQKRFAAAAAPQPPPPGCVKPNVPGVQSDYLIYAPLYLSLLAAAFKCGLTKFGIVAWEGDGPKLPGLYSPDDKEGLHGMIHGGRGTDLKHANHTVYNRFTYNHLANNFFNLLDVPEGNTGKTYLENMVTAIIYELGVEPAAGGGHWRNDQQHVLIGSMGGALRAGRYLALPVTNDKRLPVNCLHETLFQLMGVPSSEYSRFTSDKRGFGAYPTAAGHPYASRFYSPITELLTG